MSKKTKDPELRKDLQVLSRTSGCFLGIVINLGRNSNLREPSRFTSVLEFKEALEAAVTITSSESINLVDGSKPWFCSRGSQGLLAFRFKNPYVTKAIR